MRIVDVYHEVSLGDQVLYLNLKKKWFDMIDSGEKTEEYREIKPYWDNRLNRKFDFVVFRNGYSEKAPKIVLKVIDINKGFGLEKWGANDWEVYIIKLGRKL